MEPIFNAQRGTWTLMNDTVRTGLNRVRLPIPPSALWRIPSGEVHQYHHWFLELSYPKNLCFNQRIKSKFQLKISTLNKREDSNLIKSATWPFATRCRTNNPKERSSFVIGTRRTLEYPNQWIKFPKTIQVFDAHLMSNICCKWINTEPDSAETLGLSIQPRA